MIRLSIFLTRRSDLSHDEFVDYGTQKHTSLLPTPPAEEAPLRRYVQLLPTGDEIPGMSTAVHDGVAEVWADTVADTARWFTSDTCTTTVAADEDNFLDHSRTRFLYSAESPIFG